MTGLSKAIRNFFSTTRAQTNGFVALLILITVVIFSQPAMRWWASSQPRDFSKDKHTLDSLTQLWRAVESKQPVVVAERAPVYFDFDPNSISKEQFMILGFPEKLTGRIINYRKKGGKFRIKADLKRMYGMDSVLYRNVYAYINLPEEIIKPTFEKNEPDNRFKSKEKLQPFNLNEADTSQLQKIYGIGSKLAQRITKYRDKLGGFVSTTQLHEVYGLDSTVIEKLVAASYLPDKPAVKTINLNNADEKTLAAHPYFGRRIASAIVAYRFQHGNFKSVDDLGKIPLIDKNNLGKLLPYVTVDP